MTADKQALHDRVEQDNHFQAIRDAQDKDFKQTADRLKVAIDGIGSTLRSANQTVTQTRPHASLHFGAMTIVNAPNPPEGFKAGVTYEFNSVIVNDGNDEGVMLKMLRRVYIAKPDDPKDQRSLVEQFEREWVSLPRDANPQRYLAPHEGYRTDEHVFSQDDTEKLADGNTIYVLRRLEYSDPTGTWASEDCQHLQVAEGKIYIHVTHPCLMFNSSRFPAN